MMKPRLSLVVYALMALSIVGLIALGIAAFTAFSKVANFWQALFAAILIEAAMVIESITLIRRNWWAAGGILISLLVSGTYNYIQAQQAGKLHNLTDPWQLLTLAVGPLSALLFLALTIGHELREHEKRLAQWELEQKARAETRKQEFQQRETLEKQELQRREELDRQEKHALELAKIDAETKVQVAKVRAEAKEQARNLRAEGTKESETYAQVFRDWRTLPDEDKSLIVSMSTNDIINQYGVSRRTAQNWRKASSSNGHAQAGKGG